MFGHSSTAKSVLYFFTLTSMGALSFLSNLAQARLPEIQEDPKFREKVALALTRGASSFDYDVDGRSVTWIIQYGKDAPLALTSRPVKTVEKILLKRGVFKKKETHEVEGNITSSYQASFPQSQRVQRFQFYLTALNPDGMEIESDLPDLNRRDVQNRLRNEVISLMKKYTEKTHLTELSIDIEKLQIASENFQYDPEKPMRQFILESQKEKEMEELLLITGPMNRIQYIKEHMPCRSYANYPHGVYLKILQNTQFIEAPLEVLLKNDPPQADTAPAYRPDDEDVRTCLSAGGTIEVYRKGASEEALICRIGKAGIGAASLHNYKKGQKVEAIEAFLHRVDYRSDQEESFAVIPEPSSNGESGGFRLEPKKPNSEARPGLEFIPGASPSLRASSYCRQREGKPTQLESQSDGVDFKACIFKDFSGIDAGTLFAGPDAPENAQLTRVLKTAQP